MKKIKLRYSWGDLNLSRWKIERLKEISSSFNRLGKTPMGRTKRRGVITLFVGDNHIGKIMAAEILASELDLSLHKIDLSQVVSKYIGETEKNLKKLFDAAEEGGAILLFDEADALFGKRSEVKDSHDRYANIEVSYILQRIEAYPGLVILATNTKNSLDSAFLRRIRFTVSFPLPEETKRKSVR